MNRATTGASGPRAGGTLQVFKRDAAIPLNAMTQDYPSPGKTRMEGESPCEMEGRLQVQLWHHPTVRTSGGEARTAWVRQALQTAQCDVRIPGTLAEEGRPGGQGPLPDGGSCEGTPKAQAVLPHQQSGTQTSAHKAPAARLPGKQAGRPEACLWPDSQAILPGHPSLALCIGCSEGAPALTLLTRRPPQQDALSFVFPRPACSTRAGPSLHTGAQSIKYEWMDRQTDGQVCYRETRLADPREL